MRSPDKSAGEDRSRFKIELGARVWEFFNEAHQESGANGGQFVEGSDGPGRKGVPGSQDLGKPGIASEKNKPAPGGPGPSHAKGASSAPLRSAAAAPNQRFVAGNPKGLLKAGNLDLTKRPRVIHSEDGECVVSTVRSISVGMDEGTVLLPTVVGGKVVSNSDAISHFQKTGENLGLFKDDDAADAYGEALHEQQSKAYPDATAEECKAAGLTGGTAPSAPAPTAKPADVPTATEVKNGKDINSWLKNPDPKIQSVVQEVLQKVLEGSQAKGDAGQIKAAQTKLDKFMEVNGLKKPASAPTPAPAAKAPIKKKGGK